MPRASIARPHRWHGTGTVDGHFYFAWEQFAFTGDGIFETRNRPTAVAGAVWPVGGASRPILIPLAEIRQDNSLSSIHPICSVAGHLIAKQLTGLDEPENLVPVTKQTNDRMQSVENEIAKLADPHWLVVEIGSYYGADKDPRVPQSFTYSLYKATAYPGEVAPWRTWTVMQDWLQVARYDFPQEKVNLIEKAKASIGTWRIENCTAAGPRHRNLTFLATAVPPPDRRPLAFLDFLLIAYPDAAAALGVSGDQIRDYIDGIAAGGSFNPKWVRDLAVLGNILGHNNWLISDAYGRRDTVMELKEGIVVEPHQGLVAGGGANAPQVDHVVPESVGGANCFSNAQITSQQYNSQKGNAVKILQHRDTAWKNEMAEKLKTDPMIKYHPGGTSSFFGS